MPRSNTALRALVLLGVTSFAMGCGARTPIGAEAGAGGGLGGAHDMGATGGASGSSGRGGTAGTIDSSGDAGRPDVADTTLPDGCRPGSCTPPGGRYCGLIGDGCSSSIDCGDCPDGQVCGLRVANVCGTPCTLCGDVQTCDGAKTTVSGIAVTGARTRP